MADLVGKTLSRYQIVARLGRGGMAEVYKAYQPGLERYVAIKVLHRHMTDDPGFVTRFEHEALSLGTLRHPNIMQVFDFASEQDVFYMVMEFIDGPTLKAEIKARQETNNPFTLPEIANIFMALCSAVDYAHSRKMIHRDIKPANVMINQDGQIVLTDFGIARVVGGAQHTVTGALTGTPAYMSPEQGRGERADERSDIYSLGVMLYELVTGSVPYDADTPFAVIMKHVGQPLSLPRQLNPDLPEAVEQVVIKALMKDPADRYQTAGELAKALREAADVTDDRLHQPLATVVGGPKTRDIELKPGLFAKPEPTSTMAGGVVEDVVVATIAGSAPKPSRSLLIGNLIAALLIVTAVFGFVLLIANVKLGVAAATVSGWLEGNWPWLALVTGLGILVGANRQRLQAWQSRRRATRYAPPPRPAKQTPPPPERVPQRPEPSSPAGVAADDLFDEDSTFVLTADAPPFTPEIAGAPPANSTGALIDGEASQPAEDLLSDVAEGELPPLPAYARPDGVTLIQTFQEILHIKDDGQHGVRFHREIAALLSEQSNHLVEDWLKWQDSAQLRHMLSRGSSTRLLLTGFGSFGGTSLVRGVTAKLMESLAQEQDSRVLVVRLESPRYAEDHYQLFINENYGGVVNSRVGEKQLFKMVAQAMRRQANTGNPQAAEIDKNTFFGLSQVFLPGELYLAQLGQPLTQLLFQLLKLLEVEPATPDLLPVLQRLFTNIQAEKSGRLILIIDRIDQVKPLTRLLDSPLVNQAWLSIIVVARYEKLKNWPGEVRRKLPAKGFKEHYVRRYWERDLDLVKELQRIMQIDMEAGDREQQRRLATFLDHLTYTARGSIALALRELRSMYDWSEEEDHLVMDISARYLRNREEMEHNATIQRILTQNWDEIIESLFNLTEMADQARIGVYYVLDWIRRHPIFTREALSAAAAESTIPISNEADLREEVLHNLLRLLQQKHYLAYQPDRDRYKLVWRKPLVATPQPIPPESQTKKTAANKANAGLTVALLSDTTNVSDRVKSLTVQIAFELLEAKHYLLIVELSEAPHYLCSTLGPYWPLYTEEVSPDQPPLTLITTSRRTMAETEPVETVVTASLNEQIQEMLTRTQVAIIVQQDEMPGSIFSPENVASRAVARHIPVIPVGAAGGAAERMWDEIYPDLASHFRGRISGEDFKRVSSSASFVPEVARAVVKLAERAGF